MRVKNPGPEDQVFHSGINLQSSKIKGKTAVMYAKERGHLEIVQLLTTK
jgi:hypothetical protein